MLKLFYSRFGLLRSDPIRHAVPPATADGGHSVWLSVRCWMFDVSRPFTCGAALAAFQHFSFQHFSFSLQLFS
jgi:hypothetical protein